MLQEANLLREWVTLSSQSKDRPPDAKEVLLQAQATAQEAIEQLGAGGGQRSLRSVLATELATALGAETVDAVNRDASPGEVSESFHRLRRAVQAARSENPHPFYPVDVLVWTTTSVLQKDALGETERLEAIADVFHSLETIDPESLDPSSAERYQKRRLGLGMLLGDEHLTDVAFEELDFRWVRVPDSISVQSNEAGLHSRTSWGWAIAGRLESALSYLEQHRGRIRHDPRCLSPNPPKV